MHKLLYIVILLLLSSCDVLHVENYERYRKPPYFDRPPRLDYDYHHNPPKPNMLPPKNKRR